MKPVEFAYDIHGQLRFKLEMLPTGCFTSYLLQRLAPYRVSSLSGALDLQVQVLPLSAAPKSDFPAAGAGLCGRDCVRGQIHHRGAIIKWEYDGIESAPAILRIWTNPIGRLVFPGTVLDPILRHVAVGHECIHLHAAAMVYGQCGSLFTADSRVGKTALALTLAEAGWRYMGDDMIPLRQGVLYSGLTPVNFHFHIRRFLPRRCATKKTDVWVKYLLCLVTGGGVRLYSPLNVEEMGLKVVHESPLKTAVLMSGGDKFSIKEATDRTLFIEHIVSANRKENMFLDDILALYGSAYPEKYWRHWRYLLARNLENVRLFEMTVPHRLERGDIDSLMKAIGTEAEQN